MRKSIYAISVLVIFTVLIAGVDNYFGQDIKMFSMIVFPIWTIQVLSKNWNDIRELGKILFGVNQKNDFKRGQQV